MESTAYWDQIQTGTTVYDISGEKLGHVTYVDPQGQYLQVEKGWFFIKDFYVPVSAIAQLTADGIQLNLGKDDLSHERYDTAHMANSYDTADTAVTDPIATGAGNMPGTVYGRTAADMDDSMREDEANVPVYQKQPSVVGGDDVDDSVPAHSAPIGGDRLTDR